MKDLKKVISDDNKIVIGKKEYSVKSIGINCASVLGKKNAEYKIINCKNSSVIAKPNIKVYALVRGIKVINFGTENDNIVELES